MSTMPPPSPQQSHAKYSPSKLSRIIACPGSARFTQDTEDKQASSAYADEGTLLHLVTSESLDLDQFILPSDLIAKYNLTDEQCQAVQECLDYAFALVHSQPTASYIVESRVTLAGFVNSTTCPELEDVAGTLDFSLTTKDNVLYVCDWKFGAGVEVFPTTPQLKAYALGRIASPGNLTKYREVHLVIVQPRTRGEDIVKELVLSPGDLYHWLRMDLVPALILINAKHPIYRPSDEACRWCPIKHTCSARRELAQQLAVQVFSVHEQLPTVEHALVTDLLDQAPLLISYLKDLEDFVVSTLLHGTPVSGYKLVAGKSNRAWADESKAKDFLLCKGIDDQLLHTFKFKSPAQVEKLVSKQLKADPEFTALIVKPEGKATLVKDSDKRPALQLRSATDIFAQVCMTEEI